MIMRGHIRMRGLICLHPLSHRILIFLLSFWKTSDSLHSLFLGFVVV
ncbi:hypothetical protein OIU78_026619 [Salix suchowensis]|nr:hypothetical protein OIU78_026619 [Salix suchowensis]